MNAKSNSGQTGQASFVRAGSLAQLPEGKSMTANLDGHVIADAVVHGDLELVLVPGLHADRAE